jgi:hypothetical protein
MDKEVMSEEVVLEEIKRWSESLGQEPPAPSRKLLRAAMCGRIVFDEAQQVFTVKLLRPVQLENGELVDSLTIREPSSGQIRQAAQGKGEIEVTMRLLSAVTGQPVGVLDRVVQRDLLILSEAFSFFA